MKKNITFFTSFFLTCVMIFSVAAPSVLQAQSTNILDFQKPSLIICGESPAPAPGTTLPSTDPHHPCGFNDLIQLVNNAITFFFYLSIPVTVVMISIAGFRVVMAGDNEEQLKKAKNLALNVMIGFGLLCGAWAIVYFVVSPFLSNGYTLFKP